MTRERSLGGLGEGLTVRHLERQGYKVLDRNWHCRYGELDIVAANEAYLAFVEGKTRRDSRYAPARDAGNRRKREKLLLTAQAWLAEHPAEQRQPRFDVAEVYTEEGGGRPLLNYLENAFGG